MCVVEQFVGVQPRTEVSEKPQARNEGDNTGTSWSEKAKTRNESKVHGFKISQSSGWNKFGSQRNQVSAWGHYSSEPIAR